MEKVIFDVLIWRYKYIISLFEEVTLLNIINIIDVILDGYLLNESKYQYNY